MKTLQLHEVKAHLSELIEAVMKGEEITISRYGKPVAKLVGLAKSEERELGFYPIHFQSNLLEPTEDDVIDAFYNIRNYAE